MASPAVRRAPQGARGLKSLQRMIDAKEISSAEITVPEGQEETILEDETMRVKIRYVSRGYIREVEVDLGRAQPSD